MDAAEALLLETGSKEAVSIRAIAGRVGCTPPAIYLHFEDKDHLFFEVCESRFGLLSRSFDGALTGIDDPIERLRALGRAYVRFGLENPEHYRSIMMADLPDLPQGVELWDLQGMKAFSLLVQMITEGIEAGVLRDQDPFTAAVATWGTLHGCLALWLLKSNFPFPDIEALMEQVIENVVITLRK